MTLIGDQIRPDSNQNAAISPTLQVLLDLRYLATGTFRRVMGALVGVERTTAGKKIRNIIAALVSFCHRALSKCASWSHFRISKGEDGRQETDTVAIPQFMVVRSDHSHKTAINAQLSWLSSHTIVSLRPYTCAEIVFGHTVK